MKVQMFNFFFNAYVWLSVYQLYDTVAEDLNMSPENFQILEKNTTKWEKISSNLYFKRL